MLQEEDESLKGKLHHLASKATEELKKNALDPYSNEARKGLLEGKKLHSHDPKEIQKLTEKQSDDETE